MKIKEYCYYISCVDPSWSWSYDSWIYS